MSSITNLLLDTITALKSIISNFDNTVDANSQGAMIITKLQTVLLNATNVNATTVERYMTFMNENIFPKLSTENVLNDLHQLVPVLERLVVLVSDDGLSLEQALQMVQVAKEVAVVAEAVSVEARQKPASFACVLSVGKRMLPLISRFLASLKCSSASSVQVASPVHQTAEQLPSMEQPQPTDESAPAPPSLEGREAEPSPSASDNTDQKEESSN